MSPLFNLAEMKWPAAVRAFGRDRMAAFAFRPEHEQLLFANLNKVFAAVEVYDSH
jgi:hypothetical protein